MNHLDWAAAAVGPQATIEQVSPLAGGTHARTDLLRTANPTRELVLRRFPPGDAAAREATVLTALDGLDGLAPRLVAADPTGQATGRPTTLITRIPGHPDIRPADPQAAATELGRTLARVHATPQDRIAQLRDGMCAAGHVPLDQPSVLTHYDFWTGNVLWDGPTITGVIDWSGASRAPRGFDVSWCRLDLVLLHDHATADTFLAAYQDAAGQEVPDIGRWDDFALANSRRSVETWLPNYHDLGRTDLTAADLRARHTAWARR
ncbi:MAG TPA: aminoglycoside phosphotransferase family protein [Pseudonocardiaceae bacterium]|nr:aminoglycoside phosphotransferase family protein [Pseudonocardiaceae bacterium]